VKVAIITDQHFGCHRNSKLFHDYFLEFYDNVFFPTLIKEGITTVIDMGDTFDSRKGVDFSALSWAKNNYYDRLAGIGCDVITVVGNHTAYYKNSNKINAVDLLLREYKNVRIISHPEELVLHGEKILFIPWINSENKEDTFNLIKKTDSQITMGHLELNGFQPYKGHIMEDGMETGIFDKFKLVFSGHYHTRSNNGKIFYLGNPYEIYWNDVDDVRGFHLFDLKTQKLTPINNPYSIYSIIKYFDIPHTEFDYDEYKNKIVKVIVKQKTDQNNFEKFIDKLYSSNVADVKIIENFDTSTLEDIEVSESEDTFSILQKFIDIDESNLNKNKIVSILKEIYKEAYEMI
jgi:UDP-2,3-diacylglucosamine pyrophosphatase LpxH